MNNDRAMNIELRLIEPAKNKARLYGMHVVRTLFGETCLVLSWGRIGHRLRRHEVICASRRELAQRWNDVLERRRRRGYDVPAVARMEVVAC